jgi:phosphotransacetylase
MVTKVNGTLTDSQREEAIQGIEEVESSLPFSKVTLSPLDIARLTKAGPKTATFVIDGLELAIRNPDLMPASVNVIELQDQLTLIRNLDVLTAVVAQFQQKLVNTSMVAKSQAYNHARTAYFLLKRKNADGLIEGRNRLAQRFAKQGRRKAETTPAELTA